MAYKSEADQLREKLEAAELDRFNRHILYTDALEWNKRLAEETLRIREANRLLRHENAGLHQSFFAVAYLVAMVILWTVIT